MKNKDILTKKQRRIYDFIKGHLTAHGKAPTLLEIATKMGLKSLRTVTQHLEALQRKGVILRNRYAQRGIKLVEDQKPVEEVIQIPVFASAGCGSPSVIAERTFDEYVSVSSGMIDGEKDNLFVIRAVGNSMVDAGIRDGDFILVRQTDDVSSNDDVVAIIGDNAVVKRIVFADNAVILNPVNKNSDYQPIILKRDFQIFGKVIQTIKVERGNDYQIVPINEQ